MKVRNKVPTGIPTHGDSAGEYRNIGRGKAGRWLIAVSGETPALCEALERLENAYAVADRLAVTVLVARGRLYAQDKGRSQAVNDYVTRKVSAALFDHLGSGNRSARFVAKQCGARLMY